MKITHINHSGFLVEEERFDLLLDWYTGKIPAVSKPLYVFVSHSHSDHYSRKIWNLDAEKYILSSDIPETEIPKEKREQVIRMKAHADAEICDGLSVSTLRSNDLGAAFLLNTEEGKIYFAGDLNNWWWEGDEEDRSLEKVYHQELERIKGMHFRAAMIPYDLRLKEPGYGIRDFLQYCSADEIHTMHWNADRDTVSKRIEQEEYGGCRNVYV